jgi:DNA-binding transcriptional ArsR family regulator
MSGTFSRPAGPRRRANQRFACLNCFIDSTLHRVNRSAGLTWLVLFRGADPDRYVTMAQTDIASRSGLDARTVKRALKELRNLGLVKLVRVGTRGRVASTYRIRPTVPLEPAIQVPPAGD